MLENIQRYFRYYLALLLAALLALGARVQGAPLRSVAARSVLVPGAGRAPAGPAGKTATPANASQPRTN